MNRQRQSVPSGRLVGDVGEARREAAGRELEFELAGAQGFDGIAEGDGECVVSVAELAPGLLGCRMESGGL